MDALYQKQILALAKTARASVPLESWTHSATVTNPTCGDRVEIYLTIDSEQIITKLSTSIRGCALCEAGAGLLHECLPGTAVGQIGPLRQDIAAWMTNEDANIPENAPQAVETFMPVRPIRNRHKCVLLSFDAAAKAVTNVTS